MTPEHRILWTVTDPRGLTISLAEDVWQGHIIAKHPEVMPYLDQVRMTAHDPDEIYFDPVSSAQKTAGTKVYHYYKHGLFQDRFRLHFAAVVVKVVVEPDNVQRGYVETATLPTIIRKKLVLEWKK